MLDGLVDTAAGGATPRDQGIYGVALGKVVDNQDLLGQGRVQVHLPWMPIDPWARVAVLMAGASAGTYFIPQIGNEVLVAFNRGDVSEVYVIGCLWNKQDPPPATESGDPRNKRLIRTPRGHEIVFDDQNETVRITSNKQQKITLSPTKIVIQMAHDTATVTLEEGRISMQANSQIEIEAPTVRIQGRTVELKSDASMTVNGGADCSIEAGTVRIN